MTKERWAFLARLAVSVLLTVGVTSALFFARYGVPLWGVPSPKEVVSIAVARDGETKVYTDPDKIELAVKLVNHLNYQPFTPPSEETGPDIAITYTLRDGRELTAGANWITGWWNGEAHALKEPDTFINLAEGIFFWPEVASQQN